MKRVIWRNRKKGALQVKNMNKKIVFILIIVSLLLIAGCTGGSKDKRPITDFDIRKGTDGLDMKFTENTPPKSVFEDSIFPIAINLKNKGAFDIDDEEGGFDGKNGTLVFGFERDYIDMAEKEKDDEGNIKKITFDIKGKSIFNPAGDEEFITINAQAKEIGEQSETRPSTILATVCYPYKTILGTSICVDTDIYGIGKGEKACSIKDLRFSEGQGAPVTITKIETRMLPQDENKVKPHFLIHVENRGKGEVINQ